MTRLLGPYGHDAVCLVALDAGGAVRSRVIGAPSLSPGARVSLSSPGADGGVPGRRGRRSRPRARKLTSAATDLLVRGPVRRGLGRPTGRPATGTG